MRYICFDIGDKRTGIALGDDETLVVSPLGMMECAPQSGLLDRMILAIDEHEPDEIVVGLPLNMDGTHGRQAKRITELAETLSKKSGKLVHLHDERLTSFAADESMSQSGLTHQQKKQRRDAIAAALILKGFLDHHRSGTGQE